MLKITIPELEIWNNETESFMNIPEHTLSFEHSLLSISKWEAKHCKPFLSDKLTANESIDYFKCMLITQNVDTTYFSALPPTVVKQLMDYIESPMTATTFSNNAEGGGSKRNKAIITSELIYYWMIVHQIPFECEKWHLNRLLTLIRVCNAKNGDQKKMSKGEILSRNKSLNAARRAKLHSRG